MIRKSLVALVLARDGQCVIASPHCTGEASVADHRVGRVSNNHSTVDRGRIKTASKELVTVPRGLTLNQGLVDWRAAMQSTRTCSISGCDKPHYGRSFCRLHWERNHVNGDPLLVRTLRGATLEERLEHYSKPVGDCIEFTGYRDVDGYGHMKVNAKDVQAHRVSYTINVGPIPDGLIVRHQCDNPPCIKPQHLEVGTYRDNTQDKMRRTYTSAGNPSAKLTDAKVAEIRAALGRGERASVLARRFGVGSSTIGRIKHGTHWNSGPR